ncbi:hypothetical protein [Conyzicola nivalis]
MTRLRRPPQGYRKLRPHPWLFRQGLVATLAFLVPTFGVLYFLTVPDGPWPVVVATQVVASVAIVLACRSYFRVGVWIDRRGIAERGLLGRTTTMQTADVGSIVLVRTFEGGGAETVPQLFVCDHDGNQVIRLRGQFWSESDMRIVCDELDVTVTELNESVTPRELLERYPGLLYWFERRPVLAAALFSAAVLVVGSLLYFGLAAIGIT